MTVSKSLVLTSGLLGNALMSFLKFNDLTSENIHVMKALFGLHPTLTPDYLSRIIIIYEPK